MPQRFECELLGEVLRRVGFIDLETVHSQIFTQLAAKEPTPRYGLTWTYLTQAVNGHSTGLAPLGYVFFEGESFVAAGAFRRPADGQTCVHFVAPKSCPSSFDVGQLAGAVQEQVPGVPVYLKKAPASVRETALSQGFRRVRAGDIWHPLAPWEDDTIPGRILRLAAGPEGLRRSSSEVATKIRRFQRKVAGKELSWVALLPKDAQTAMHVVCTFFASKLQHHVDVSVPTDYSNMIHFPPVRPSSDTVRELLLCDGEPIALLIMERLNSSNAFGLYCNLSLYTRHPYLSEFVMARAIGAAGARNGERIYLGGSETQGLDDFKKKFGADQEVDTYEWLIRDS